MAVLRGCLENKVKRLVITSSIAAMIVNGKRGGKITVEDWSDPEIAGAYEKSKTLAEKAAWEFLEGIKGKSDLEIVTINPGVVFGPNLNKAQFSSGDIIKRTMMNDFPGVPKINLGCVDVRDVALAHLNAVLVPEARN